MSKVPGNVVPGPPDGAFGTLQSKLMQGDAVKLEKLKAAVDKIGAKLDEMTIEKADKAPLQLPTDSHMIVAAERLAKSARAYEMEQK